MAEESIFPLEAFYLVPGTSHVCAAGESLPLQCHSAAFVKYMEDKAAGHVGPKAKSLQLNYVRAVIAREWNAASPKEIGFAPSVADGVAMIVESLHWEEGDNVVVDPHDFPSLIAPFATKAQSSHRGTDSGFPEIAMPEQTLSTPHYVSYLNGARVDLSHYRRLADKAGAILVVDYSQAAGWAPISVPIADFAFSCCHKWLLGVTGAAIAYWNKSRQPSWRPVTAGWHSLSSLPGGQAQWEPEALQFRDDALVFSRGNPSHLSIYILRESLDFLSRWDAVQVERHVQTLTTSLIAALVQERIVPSTPTGKERHGASVTVHCKGAAAIVDEMREAGVYAWNGSGRVRFSFHGYNCRQDVERIMGVFPGLWRKYNL